MNIDFTFFSYFAQAFMSASQMISDFVFSYGSYFFFGLTAIGLFIFNVFSSPYRLVNGEFFESFDRYTATIVNNPSYGLVGFILSSFVFFYLFKLIKAWFGGW